MSMNCHFYTIYVAKIEMPYSHSMKRSPLDHKRSVISVYGPLIKRDIKTMV